MPQEDLDDKNLIGQVIHYFDQIGVAVIGLSKALKVGDQIRFVGGETDFTQDVSSMEVEHKKIDKAKAKQEVGMKVEQKVRPGYRVYKA
jgi:putative protease